MYVHVYSGRGECAPHVVKDVHGKSYTIYFPVDKGPGGMVTDQDLERAKFIGLYSGGALVCRTCAKATEKQQEILKILHKHYAAGEVYFAEPTTDCFANFIAMSVTPKIAAEFALIAADAFKEMAMKWLDMSTLRNLSPKNVFVRFIQHLNKYGIQFAGEHKDFGYDVKLIFRIRDWNRLIPLKVDRMYNQREKIFVLSVDGIPISKSDVHDNDTIIQANDKLFDTTPVVCAFNKALRGLALANSLVEPPVDAEIKWRKSNRIGMHNALLDGGLSPIHAIDVSGLDALANQAEVLSNGMMQPVQTLAKRKAENVGDEGKGKGKAEMQGGSSKKGKAEMQGGSSKNTLHQEAGLLMTLCHPPKKAPLYPDDGYESWMGD